MNLSEFYQWFNGGVEPKPRIIACATRQDVKDARQWLERQQTRTVGVSRYVTERGWYPMPNAVLGQLKEDIASDEAAVVCGLDGYAELLSEARQQDLYAELKNWIDDNEPAAWFVVHENALPKLRNVFYNPRYTSGKNIVYINEVRSDVTPPPPLPTIYLVSERWLEVMPPDVKSLQAYLEAYEAGTLHGARVRIAVPAKNEKHLPGLRDDVRQVMTLRDFMSVFYEVEDPLLSDAALERMRREGIPASASIKEFIAADSVQREIVFWRLKQQAQPDTYLWYVFDNGATPGNFIERFVCAASTLLACSDAKKLAAERKEIIEDAELRNFEAHIPSFIEMTRDAPAWQKIAWLNNGTDAEKAALLQILGSDYSERIRKEVFAVYPDIEAYLSPDANAYFTEYRTLKIQGKCTDAFAQKALDHSQIPDGMKARNILLKAFENDGETALLVVDALGAEWLPMITALAEKRGLRMVSANVGYANIPTVTSVNKIEWPPERKLDEIKKLDNIAHNGAEAHAAKTSEENLRVQLDVISNDVMRAIGNGLAKHPRVLLTADHGTSRLAVCAWNQGIAKTLESLPSNAEILDWRYCQNATETDGLEKSLSGAYFVVCGYNRLPKPGGKVFEVHGGATLEERLVPVIVFEQGVAQKSDAVAKPVSELEENDPFA